MSSSSDEEESARPIDLRSFGRRRGRKASDRQRQLIETLLPHLSIDATALARQRASGSALVEQLFGHSYEEMWLEIGFGGGEHLISQARANPHVGIIGAEPFEDGVVKVLSVIEEGGLDNVRLLSDDVRPLLRSLPAASLARVFVLFPDPWPKRRHRKRRLIQSETVSLIAEALRVGGELRFASDIGDYVRTALAALISESRFAWTASSPQDWRARSVDWPQTRYEQKAIREGRRCYYFNFRRIA